MTVRFVTQTVILDEALAVGKLFVLSNKGQ